MKYMNGNEILPDKLMKELQNYAEGIYVYIPKKNGKKNKWGEKTNYHREMELRNQHIYDKHLEGVAITQIVNCYHLSSQSIRRIILTEKRKTKEVALMIKELIKEWNIECAPIQIYHSAWNINDLYVLKIYDNVDTLHRNITMMQTLYKTGIPVPRVIALDDGRDYLEREKSFYLLTTKLKGKNIVRLNEYDNKWFYNFGTILAELHLGFLECEKNISYWNNSMLEEMKGWVKRDLYKYNQTYLDWKDIEKSIGELEEIYEDLPKQLIHRDVYLGNFLFDQDEFSGYIDFDLSQSNIRIFDLCYFLLGILLEENNNRVEEEKWYGILQQVVLGYDAISSLSNMEKRAISCVMKNIELLFVAYFLGQGDEKLAKDAASLYSFVLRNEKLIDSVVLT